MNAINTHELLFVQEYVIPERRQRWLEALGNPKRRDSFLSRLADPRDFIPKLMHPILPALHRPDLLLNVLKELGAPKQCYIVSQLAEIDGATRSLSDSLETVVGIGLGTVLSCVPGKLLYYEEEMPKKRWILKNK